MESGLRLRHINCEARYISDEDGIGEGYKRWWNRTPVIIDAPTGSGKNTFILDVLAPYASSEGKFVLLLCNRSALGQQQKRKLWGRQSKRPIASSDLDRKYCFGNILIFSYQRILTNISDLLAQFNIGYVVFDEAHFFLSDARFNSDTDLILASLIGSFCGAARIYMSATPQDARETILEYEQRLLDNQLNDKELCVNAAEYYSHSFDRKPELITYYFSPNYKHCAFHFFNSWKMVGDCIVASPAEEKWLIFIQQESEYTKIKEILKGKVDKKDIEFIDAKKKASPIYEQITRNGKFDARILVSTIVLDNGINFNDSSLKHVVIHSLDEVSTVQMAGRKRRSLDEHVNFYFMTTTLQEVKKIDQATKGLIALVDEFHKNQQHFINKTWGNLGEDAQKLFRVLPTVYQPPQGAFASDAGIALALNTLAERKLHYDKGNLEYLIGILQNNQETGLQEEILQWFKYPGKFSPEMQLEGSSERKQRYTSELEDWLEEKAKDENAVGQDNWRDLYDAFSEHYETILGKKLKNIDNTSRLVKSISSALKELGVAYTFKKTKKDHTTPEWKFVSLEDEKEHGENLEYDHSED